MKTILFILLCLQPLPQKEEVENHDPDVSKIESKDPVLKERDIGKDLYIYISDQKDFETEFVRQTFDIPNDILSGKLKSKYPSYLNEWLVARRKLKYQLIVNPTVYGPPLIGFNRFDKPKVLAYPYKAVPHHVIFIRHLHYLHKLYNYSSHKDLSYTQSISLETRISRRNNRTLSINKFSLCVDDVEIDVSPLIDYHPFVHIDYNDSIIMSFGPTIEEQNDILDAGTGFLKK